MAEIVTVGIVEDHAVFTRGLVALLHEAGGIAVVWTVDSVDTMLTDLASGRERPDLVILDRSLPGGGPQRSSAIEAVLAVGLRVLVLSATRTRGAVDAALQAGASGYASKNAPEHELVDAVRCVAAGGTFLSSDVRVVVGAQPNPFSPRQLEIVHLLARGYSDASIAGELLLSTRTVAKNLERIQEKIGVRRRGMIVRWAVDNGYLELD